MIQPPLAELTPYVDRLRDAHGDYVTTVSHAEMAASLRTCAYLWWLVDRTGARKVCDLGSGFTSYTLRQTGATVHSVDDNADWLRKSRDFAGGGGCWLNVQDWLTLQDHYQIIFHDVAGGHERDELTTAAMNRLALFGVIVFDDAHHPVHHAAAAVKCAERGWPLYDLWMQTGDEFGRHAIAAVNES